MAPCWQRRNLYKASSFILETEGIGIQTMPDPQHEITTFSTLTKLHPARQMSYRGTLGTIKVLLMAINCGWSNKVTRNPDLCLPHQNNVVGVLFQHAFRSELPLLTHYACNSQVNQEFRILLRILCQFVLQSAFNADQVCV